jgi:hypothetical protein
MSVRVPRGVAVLLLSALVLVCRARPCRAENFPSPAPGVYKAEDGRALTEDTLVKLFAAHRLWVASDGKKGTPASCHGCDLTGAPLGILVQRAAMLNGNDGLDPKALPEITLTKAILKNADLSGMDLHLSFFNGADLEGANFYGSNLTRAMFTGANLRGTRFAQAILEGANLLEVDVTEADFGIAFLAGAIYGPRQKTIPNLYSLAHTAGLDQLRFGNSEAGLIELRSALRNAGMHEREREVNCAIQRNRTHRLHQAGKMVEAGFRYVFFDLTCKYGMDPGRPLRILGLGVFVFAIPYFGAILFRRQLKRSGVWVIRDPETVNKRRKTRPLPVAMGPFPGVRPRGRIRTVLRAGRVAFFFSLLSAFSIGFREINVRSWIVRLQSREYTLRGTGWVRAVAGFQSLLSVYLLALWMLTYFGRPFE